MKKLMLFVLPFLMLMGCASFSDFLRKASTIVDDAEIVVNEIAAFTAHQSLDAETQAKVNDAIARAHAADQTLLRAIDGASDMKDKDVVAALSDFHAAYDALMQVVHPLGVSEQPAPGSLPAAMRPGGLLIKRPLALDHS